MSTSITPRLLASLGAISLVTVGGLVAGPAAHAAAACSTTSPALLTTVTCSSAGSDVITIPSGAAYVTFTVIGGGAGGSATQTPAGLSATPGSGASITGVAQLPSGTATLSLVVGAGGVQVPNPNGTGSYGGNGGGGSGLFAVDGSSTVLADLVVSGGGGGSGSSTYYQPVTGSMNGGNAGLPGASAQPGAATVSITGASGSTGAPGGGAGPSSAGLGGAAGAGVAGGDGGAHSTGAVANGGTRGTVQQGTTYATGGGGGGGYYGGGGGGSGNNGGAMVGAAGGGGSSYVHPTYVITSSANVVAAAGPGFHGNSGRNEANIYPIVTPTAGSTGRVIVSFSVSLPPAVTSVAPATGSTSGGQVVTITGTGFVSGATVGIGGNAATAVSVVSSTQITATTPPGTAGTANVVVTNPDTQSGTGTGIYTYATAPTVTAIVPSLGTISGGDLVEITGTGFVNGATVTIGGAAATGVAWNSSTSLAAVTPPGSAGGADVTVTNPNSVSGTAAGLFTFVAPTPPSGGGTTPEPAPTPTPTPIPTSAPTPGHPLNPITDSENAHVPTAGLPAGTSLLLANGLPVPVTVSPNAASEALLIHAPGLTPPLNMRLEGRGDDADPLGLTSKQALILQSQPVQRAGLTKTARVQPVARSTGDGFKSLSPVKFYILPSTYLGTLTTDATGAYAGALPVPPGITPGVYTLQANGLAPDGAVRSLSIGVLVKPTHRLLKTASAKASVYFDSLSAVLTPQAKRTLQKLAHKAGRTAVTTVTIGYVQPTSATLNDEALSTARATQVAKYLHSLGVKGRFTVRGDGRDGSGGATARRVDVTITYTTR